MWAKFVNRINWATKYLGIVILAVMVVIVFLQIVLRIMNGTSFNWISDLSKYSMIWIIFLGSALAFQTGAHVGIDLITDRLSLSVQKIVLVISGLISTVFLVAFFYTGLGLVNSTFSQISPNLKIPMAYIYLVLPLSAVLMLINLIDTIIHFIKTGKLAGGIGGSDV